MNVLYLEAGYHNVGIFMGARVDKETLRFRNMEPEKCTDWQWCKWDEYVQKERLFIPFKYFFEKGFKDLNKVKSMLDA